MAKFEIGNKEAEIWDEEQVRKVFNQMVVNTIEDKDILSLQDAILSVNLYSSSINYLVEKFPVFETIKKDIQDIIVSRVNKGAIKGEFNPASSIWRMKQCGEVERSEIKNEGSMEIIWNENKSYEPKH